jgi:hypothetical protein
MMVLGGFENQRSGRGVRVVIEAAPDLLSARADDRPGAGPPEQVIAGEIAVGVIAGTARGNKGAVNGLVEIGKVDDRDVVVELLVAGEACVVVLITPVCVGDADSHSILTCPAAGCVILPPVAWSIRSTLMFV